LCTSVNVTHRRSCNVDDHTSWARDCPTFIRKCQEYNTKHPENSLPYYHSSEPWIWATGLPSPDPTTRYRSEGPLFIRKQTLSQKLRQSQLQFWNQPTSNNNRHNHPMVNGLEQGQIGRAPQECPPFPHPQMSSLDDFNTKAPPFNTDPQHSTQ